MVCKTACRRRASESDGRRAKKRSMKWKIGTGKRELEHQLNWAWMVAEWVTEMGCETVYKAACGSDLRDGFAESERGFNRKAWQNPFSVMGICHASPVFPWTVFTKRGDRSVSKTFQSPLLLFRDDCMRYDYLVKPSFSISASG